MSEIETKTGDSGQELSQEQRQRRSVLRFFGAAALGCGAVAAAASAASSAASAAGAAGGQEAQAGAKPDIPDIPGYNWHEHEWGYGVDATRCIGCLRCVEACKIENNVQKDAHHFRTWVERYVYLEGEDKAHIDSQADPVNIAASGSEAVYRFANRYKDAKVDKAFFVPKLCNHCTHPACVQVCPVGATFKTDDGVVLIDHKLCIGCQYCVQACPYGARFFDDRLQATNKCTWCYHRITKGLLPACVEVCPVSARIFGDRKDPQSPISKFLRDNRTFVLRPESGNAPNVNYIGIDKEVS